MDKLISLLKNFNFTESESKAYIALLQNGMCTGYEVSKLSGVPRSKIYNVLNILVNRGAVLTSYNEKSVMYTSVPADDLIVFLRKSSDEMLDSLQDELFRFDHELDEERIWQMRDYSNIISKCTQMICSAKQQVLMQIWSEDLTGELESELIKKQQSIGRVLVVLYDSGEKYETQLKTFYRHGFERDKIAEKGSRWITLSIDSNTMIYASIHGSKVAEGVLTKNSTMVFFANEYIKHDAYCLRLIEAMGYEKVKDVFGNDMEGIRDIFKMK